MSFSAVRQIVGDSIVEWDEKSPLRWVMHQPSSLDHQPLDEVEFDLTSLSSQYADAFLHALKDVLILSKHRTRLNSIFHRCQCWRQVLSRVATSRSDDVTLIERIDASFMMTLNMIQESVPASYLNSLKALFNRHRSDARIFESNLRPSDFPTGKSKYGAHGRRVKKILALTLPKATLVHVLNVAETSFEQRQLDIGRYAFIRLALNIFARPDSYRRLTLSNLKLDQDKDGGSFNYFLDVPPAKSRVHKPRCITYRLHAEVGKLLALQRQAVIERFGHLAPVGDMGPEYGKLALFPAINLNTQGEWQSLHANERLGTISHENFSSTYLKPIQKLAHTALSFNALRHTIGTQLAMMGCSSHTIQAVLKHATQSTAQAYVDIVFGGLIDELSDGLQPAFEAHFPVFQELIATNSSIPLERRIESEDLETGRTETTGLCGRQAACTYAPISCYACHRFIPCYDADHSINLNIVNREISAYDGKGRAMQHEVNRWKIIRNHIRVVIAACEIKVRSVESMRATGEGA